MKSEHSDFCAANQNEACAAYLSTFEGLRQITSDKVKEIIVSEAEKLEHKAESCCSNESAEDESMASFFYVQSFMRPSDSD